MQPSTFDPKRIVIVYFGNVIGGYAEDNFIEVDFLEESFTIYIGADGEASRALNRNQSAEIKIRLAATSYSNDTLSAIHALDRLTGAGAGDFRMEDGNGTSIAHASSAWIKKPPSTAYGKKIGEREWLLATGKLDHFVGGNYLATP